LLPSSDSCILVRKIYAFLLYLYKAELNVLVFLLVNIDTCIGRLDVKEDTYNKLYETAGLLKMSVLTKLMDAQVVKAGLLKMSVLTKLMDAQVR
jgi:hypothetical protein